MHATEIWGKLLPYFQILLVVWYDKNLPLKAHQQRGEELGTREGLMWWVAWGPCPLWFCVFSFHVISLPLKASKHRIYSGMYFPVFGLEYCKSSCSVQILDKTDQEKPCIWTFFTQFYIRKLIPARFK